MPSKPPVTMSYMQSDSVPSIVELNAVESLKTASGYTFSVHPRDLGGGYHGLERADLFVLYIIRDAFPGTPVFFSRTDGSYPDELGFGNNLVTTGLARKLVATQPTASATMIQVPGDGWFDMATSYSLWTKTFDAPRTLAQRNGWVDRASVGIPYVYVRTGAELAEALAHAGRDSDAKKVMATTANVAKATGLADLLALQPQ
jgi:hypothetical protein